MDSLVTTNAFHDINKIVEAYLDDLAAHSDKSDHPAHLRASCL